MKKLKLGLTALLVLLLSAGVALAQFSNYPNGWPNGVTIRGLSVLNTHAGKVYWVDSATGSDSYSGTLEEPYATIDYAIGKCSPNNGDIIMVAPGHTESVTANNGINIDVQGVTIVGLGTGTSRPTVTFATATTADITISSNNATIKNVIFNNNIDSQVAMMDINASNAWIEDCEFNEGSAKQALTYVDINGGAANACDKTTIKNCIFKSTAAGANRAIELGEVQERVTIGGCTIYGDFADAGIHNPTGKILTNLYIKGCSVTNTQTGDHAIELVSACTGNIESCMLFADSLSTILDPGSLKIMDVYGTSAVDTAASTLPLSTGEEGFIGGDNADNAAATTNVVANADGSVLERQEYIQTSIAAVQQDADVANMIIGSNNADNAADTSTVVGNADGSLVERAEYLQTATASVQQDVDVANLIIGSNNADNAGATNSVVANADGTVVERQEFIQTSIAAVQQDVDVVNMLVGSNNADNAASTGSVVSNPDGSVVERQQYMQALAEVLTAEQLNAVAGETNPIAVWYVDANISASGNGKSPATAFKTLTEAITASTDTVDDYILVYDYSGGGSTLTINKAFVHIIGNANPSMPYPRIMPASAVDGIEITAAGDRVEIANMVIGAGDQTKACIAIDSAGGGGAYGVYIHDCVIGRDSNAPGLLGVSVPAGGAAPYLVVKNNRFYGSAGAGIAAAGSAIKIDGNATRCKIEGNYISDIGRTATPAIWLSGSVTEPQIVGNHIKTDTDTGTGSAITLSANVDDGWIAGNWACDGKDAPANNPYVDGASTNGWSENYSGIVAVLP